MSAWMTFLEEHRQQHLDERLGFLRIPSVSSLPEHADDVRQAAVWVGESDEVGRYRGGSYSTHRRPPVVYGEWLHAPEKPTVLIYGHFDTQQLRPRVAGVRDGAA